VFLLVSFLFPGNEELKESLESLKRLLFGVAGDVVETGVCFYSFPVE